MENKQSKNFINLFWDKNRDQNIKTLEVLLVKNNCCIYGGYIRDIFNDKIPLDIDCVIFSEDFEKCKKNLIYIGYDKYIEKEDQGVVCFKSTKNLIPIDICIENVYKKTEVTLSPMCDPDFNVNLLCLYNNRIFNWAEDDDSFSVEDIIRDITSMKAKKLFAFGMDDRILKIQNKGFKIY